jgi:hypothetical protein
LRNATSWDAPFNTDREGKTYQGGKAIEITQFEWLDGLTHAEDFVDSIIATSAGYNWELDETQWKVWITTGGEVVWLRNRARHYSEDMPDYYPDGNERVYITEGLTGVSGSGDGTDYQHPHGAFVYVHSDDRVSVHGFSAFSGEHDQSIMNLLDKFCRLSGTLAEFIGDLEVASKTFTDGEEFEL